jgi:metal-responsive CopG/Arc/MetJ family transcriptional regulator
MSTIQIVLEDELLAALDARVAREDGDRSALIRNAVRDHLRRLRVKDLEVQERLGYERIPDTVEDTVDWEKLFPCPED